MNLVPTRHGLVGLTLPRPSPDPVLLVVRGFTAHNQLRSLAAPGCDTAFIDLPGFMAPTFEAYESSILAEAFDEAIASNLSGREVRLVGVSAGAIVALQMRSPQVSSVLAVEPFLDSRAAWPLVEWGAKLTGELGRFCREFFGIPGPGRRFPISAAAPLAVVAGDAPLHPPRQVANWPSLCSEADEARFRAAGARFARVRGGHDLPRENVEAIEAALSWPAPAR